MRFVRIIVISAAATVAGFVLPAAAQDATHALRLAARVQVMQ